MIQSLGVRGNFSHYLYIYNIYTEILLYIYRRISTDTACASFCVFFSQFLLPCVLIELFHCLSYWDNCVPQWLNSNASACNAGDLGLIPGWGRSPGGGNGNPFQYSCLENPMDRGVWWTTVHGLLKSWTWLSDWAQCSPLGHKLSIGCFSQSVSQLVSSSLNEMFYGF